MVCEKCKSTCKSMRFNSKHVNYCEKRQWWAADTTTIRREDIQAWVYEAVCTHDIADYLKVWNIINNAVYGKE